MRPKVLISALMQNYTELDMRTSNIAIQYIKKDRRKGNSLQLLSESGHVQIDNLVREFVLCTFIYNL